jgi:hypothetical protein
LLNLNNATDFFHGSVISFHHPVGHLASSNPQKNGRHCWLLLLYSFQGRIQGGGGAPGARPPKIGKKYDFWRKIVIFHTKYPNNFFKYAPPNLKSWIRPGFNISFYVNPYGILKIISAKNSIKLIVQKRLIV